MVLIELLETLDKEFRNRYLNPLKYPETEIY